MPSYVPSTLYIRHLLYKTGAMHNAGGELLLMGILGSCARNSSPLATVRALINVAGPIYSTGGL
jgi:hypothetical protein